MSLSSITSPLDRSSQLPLYQQLRRSLREAIESNALGSDAVLPPERDIATEFGVSRITVRKALEGLVEEGLLDRRHGAGTFVASRIQKNMAALSSFSEDVARRGWRSHSEWLSREESEISLAESIEYGLPPGLSVQRLDRLRFADDLPLAIEHAIVPQFALASIDAVETSLYAALEQSKTRPTRALQRLQAVAFDSDQASLLGVTAGDPGLYIERRGFLDDGRVVEITRSWYRGDAYDFVTELSL